MSIAPALILAILVGVFHASLYVLIRGSGGGRLPIIVIAAILGAWAGDALGDRLGMSTCAWSTRPSLAPRSMATR